MGISEPSNLSSSIASGRPKLPAQFKQRVLILGEGIAGLSVANTLLQSQKYDVTHWSDRPMDQTTSIKAAAFWYPFIAAPEDKVAAWSAETFAELHKLVGIRDSGVTMQSTKELFRKPKTDDPLWKDAVPDFRHATRDELPPGFEDAYLLTVPVAYTRFYLQWLMAQNKELGSKSQQRRVTSIQEALDEYDVVFNCTGMGSRDIAGIADSTMIAVRGQLVRIKNPGDIDSICMDEDEDITYLCPRTAPDPSQSDVILGGTADKGNESLEPDPETAQKIIERCAKHYPSIRGAEILGHVVGLRPGRPEIRVESESFSGGKVVVHNYGHGGSGYTVAHGCARDAVRLIER